MTKIKLLALGVLIATSASAAHADGKFTLGAGVGVVEHPYKQYDADVYPVPVISYESENFWFHGLGGGYYLWNDTNDKLSITAYWSPMYFKPGDSDSEQMRRLDKRKSTVMAGLSYVHNTPYLMLETKVTAVEAKEDGIYVSMEGKKAPAEAQRYDAVLVAIGRVPNGKNLDAGKAGVEVDDRGFIRVDKQMRTNVPHIFAIGDIVGQPMLAHKGVHEGHVAAEVISGLKHYFDPKVIPSIAYTEPEVAWVGLTEKEAKEKGISYETATFPWAASGRAIASDCADGMTKLIFDKETHRVIGGAIVGTNGGELLGEIGLAIEMGCDAEDIALTIHAHPTLHESVGLAAEVFEGSITDLPNAKAKKK